MSLSPATCRAFLREAHIGIEVHIERLAVLAMSLLELAYLAGVFFPYHAPMKAFIMKDKDGKHHQGHYQPVDVENA